VAGCLTNPDTDVILAPHRSFTGNHLYDLQQDPEEDENRSGEAIESDLADRLRAALIEIEAPDDQLERLGMK